MKLYWHYRKIHQLSEEEIRNLRMHILFADDLTGKLILPETSIYTAEATEDTIYRMGAITKPITQELTELSELRENNASKH